MSLILTTPLRAARRQTARVSVALVMATTLGTALLVPRQVAQADPPPWAKAFGRRNHDQDNQNDRRTDDRRDNSYDRRDDQRHEYRQDNGHDARRNSVWREPQREPIRQWNNGQSDANRQKNKNDWRNLTILGGAATVYGLLHHDPTVAFVGAAGTLYSASRYESDRRSQSESDRTRAGMFDRGYFERDGVQYTKHDKWVNGEKYYYFSR